MGDLVQGRNLAVTFPRAHALVPSVPVLGEAR